MKIALLVGSIRSERQSIKPARYLERLLIQNGHDLTFADLQELEIPLFNDDAEQYEEPGVKSLLQAVESAEAIVMVFPEYNHDVSSTLRNALSFFRKREFLHRPVGLVGVSNGLVGGARALYAAKASFPTLGAVIVPTAVQVLNVQETFPNQNDCQDERVRETIMRMIQELEAYGPALKTVREQLRK